MAHAFKIPPREPAAVLRVDVDLNNLLNANYATTYEGQYAYNTPNGGTWNNSTAILAPRFVRINFTLNY